MLWIVSAAALSATAPAVAEAPDAAIQARAVVHIVRAARIRLGEGASGADQTPVVREARVSDGEGRPRRAILVEFS